MQSELVTPLLCLDDRIRLARQLTQAWMMWGRRNIKEETIKCPHHLITFSFASPPLQFHPHPGFRREDMATHYQRIRR
jgi:hypothetical protein